MVFVVIVRVLAVVVFITLLAWLGGRLLGLRQSWARALAAAVLGVSAAALFSLAVAPQNPLPYPAFFFLVILLPALLVSMGVSALLELLVRPGPLVRVQGRLATVPHPLRYGRQLRERVQRYWQITRIAARHGLATVLEERRPGRLDGKPSQPAVLGRNLRGALEEAGGIFVKLGQILSTRSDLLPPEVIAELAQLQDRVPPVAWAEVEALLTRELGAPPAKVFASFETMPVASASIAQVYRARLASGEDVAVKVRRPGLEQMMERDLDIIQRLARTIETGTTWGHAFHVMELARAFAVALREELDLRVEARNIAIVAATARPSAALQLPHVYDTLSTSRVLVTDWLDGASVRDAAPLVDRLKLQRMALARALLEAVAGQIMLAGTFHADPHPGNVFVLRSGQLGLLDFGSVGRIDPIQQAALRNLLAAMQRRDTVELRVALREIVDPSVELDDAQLERALGRLMARYLAPGTAVGPEMIAEMFGLMRDFGIAFPPEITAVFRALVTLEGTLRVLAPGFALVDEARALAGRWVRDALMPSALGRSALDEAATMLPILRRLPRRLDRISEAMERGALTLNVRLFADARDRQVVSTLAGRAILAFLGAAVGVMSVMLLSVPGGPKITSAVSMFLVLGYLGLCASIALIMRVVVAIVRDHWI
ncbi:MAG TPA: AarF/UbiB family protein [Ktedonobacterales bacterium]|jgi:ubiquinone biosynthesis protein